MAADFVEFQWETLRPKEEEKETGKSLNPPHMYCNGMSIIALGNLIVCTPSMLVLLLYALSAVKMKSNRNSIISNKILKFQRNFTTTETYNHHFHSQPRQSKS